MNSEFLYNTQELDRLERDLTSPLLSDVLDQLRVPGQVLRSGIVALNPSSVVIGYAFPVHTYRVYEEPERPFQGLLRALDAIGEGEVFVTPTARANDIAVWGELLSTAALARGARGALTDGMVRDSRAVLELGFPVFAQGTLPLDSKGRAEISQHGVACQIDGVRIEPGDLVYGDRDGVVVVPREIHREVVEAALAKASSESEFRRAVAQGSSVVAAYERFGVL